MTKQLCYACGVEHNRLGQRSCLKCHAAYMREHRPKHRELPGLQRRRANCRAYANVYLRRGKLTKPDACSTCAAKGPVQMHHDDYLKPLEVRWLCVACHLDHHAKQREAKLRRTHPWLFPHPRNKCAEGCSYCA